jgi:ABC-type sugar transport system ATPase subunit
MTQSGMTQSGMTMTAEARSETPDALRLTHVTKIFGGVTALDDVAFSVGEGEVHCLAG